MKKVLLILTIIIGLFTIVVSSNNKVSNVTVIFNEEEYQVKEDELWVEVSLVENNNKVYVRRGNELIKEMPCSGGTKEEPTVTGVFYLQNRGERFYSERFKEGGLYWVRFYEQYLFHSVPVNENYEIIEEEEKKIGTNASHGCIRLLLEDAKWFYENVPDGTLVVIHENEPEKTG